MKADEIQSIDVRVLSVNIRFGRVFAIIPSCKDLSGRSSAIEYTCVVIGDDGVRIKPSFAKLFPFFTHGESSFRSQIHLGYYNRSETSPLGGRKKYCYVLFSHHLVSHSSAFLWKCRFMSCSDPWIIGPRDFQLLMLGAVGWGSALLRCHFVHDSSSRSDAAGGGGGGKVDDTSLIPHEHTVRRGREWLLLPLLMDQNSLLQTSVPFFEWHGWKLTLSGANRTNPSTNFDILCPIFVIDACCCMVRSLVSNRAVSKMTYMY